MKFLLKFFSFFSCTFTIDVLFFFKFVSIDFSKTNHSIRVTMLLTSFVISCRSLVSLYFSFVLFHIALLSNLRCIAFELLLVYGRLEHKNFGITPSAYSFLRHLTILIISKQMAQSKCPICRACTMI